MIRFCLAQSNRNTPSMWYTEAKISFACTKLYQQRLLKTIDNVYGTDTGWANNDQLRRDKVFPLTQFKKVTKRGYSDYLLYLASFNHAQTALNSSSLEVTLI